MSKKQKDTPRNLLEARSITKDFGQQRGAFQVNLEVKPGEIVGFIGPNGAGKTTSLLMLSGFIYPDAGKISIFQNELTPKTAYRFNNQVGVLLSDVNFPKHLTARQILSNSAQLYTRSKTNDWQAQAEQLELSLNTRFGELSLGNKKKVGIINALINKPRLVIMDEPTSGLDPLMQQKVLELLKAITNDNGAVLLSSHVLSEVQAVCDRIVMIKKGRILFTKDTDRLLEESVKRFRFPDLDNKVLKDLQSLDAVVDTDVKKDEIILYANKRQPVLEILNKHKIYNFYLEKPTLEEMFIEYYRNED